jgi:cytochrome c553
LLLCKYSSSAKGERIVQAAQTVGLSPFDLSDVCSGALKDIINQFRIASLTAFLAIAVQIALAAPHDLNGDGKSDLVFRNSTTGQISAWLMNGSSQSSAAGLVNPGNWTVSHIADFNGDGKADLLFRNDDGSTTLWLMNGLVVSGSVGLLGPDPDWRVSQVGDFNGDGKADILWRHTNGAVTVWLMNGTTVTARVGLLGPDRDWRVTHVADFNGDGKADLLWRHTNGAVTQWLMNGGTVAAATGLLGPEPNWTVSHVGDFNGDGKADLLWRHTNGAVTQWLMNGNAVATATGLLGPEPNWAVSHIGDFNGDGKADLLWRNTNGAVTVWLLNGANILSAAGLLGADANWRVTHVGDYNGDGKADLIWRHGTEGNITQWLMNGTTVASASGILGAGVWAVIPESEVASINSSSTMAAFPLEVLGAEGTEVSVVLNLSADQARLGQRLWLQTHNLRYAEKGSVKINGGAWIPLNNTTAQMIGTSQIFGGIGGSFATLKMSLPISSGQLKTGNNTVMFRFNVSNGLTVGYRIINMNLLDSAGQNLIPADAFTQSNPATWAPPSTQTADIAAGKTLWNSAQLKAHFEPASSLVAHCADCHTKTGADLKYFGYSNKAIIERSKFHGLTEAQGMQIASYIRSLPVKAVGRPWNPPYQPGPGITAKPNDEWAAGAGIDNVLDNDSDTLKAIFPNGVKREVLMEGDTTKFKRFSSHDTPLAFQLPDWNHWLPEIHPYDAFGKAWADNTNNFKHYEKIRRQLTGKTSSEIRQWFRDSDTGGTGGTYASTGYFAITAWSGYFPDQGRGTSVAEAIETFFSNKLNANGRITSPDDAKKLYSLALWKMVKHVEINEEFQLTGMGPETTGVAWAGFDGTQALPRMWVGANRVVFDVSPFLSGLEGGVTGSASGNNDFNYDYLSNSWYQLQLILNAGQRSGANHQVVDWGYAHGFLHSFNRYANFSQSGRNAVWVIKGMDEGDNGRGPNIQDGWSFKRATVEALGLNNAYTPSEFWIKNPTPLARQVHTLLRQVWLEKNASWLPIEMSTDLETGLPKSGDEDGGVFNRPEYVLGTSNQEGIDRSQAEQTNLLMPAYITYKAYPAALQNGYAAWTQAVWPGVDANGVARNNWLAYTFPRVGTAPATPTVAPGGSASTVSISWTPLADSLSYNVKRSDSPNGPFLTIAYFRTGTSYTEKVPLPGRTYYYRLTKNTDQGESPDSASVSIVR